MPGGERCFNLEPDLWGAVILSITPSTHLFKHTGKEFKSDIHRLRLAWGIWSEVIRLVWV